MISLVIEYRKIDNKILYVYPSVKAASEKSAQSYRTLRRAFKKSSTIEHSTGEDTII